MSLLKAAATSRANAGRAQASAKRGNSLNGYRQRLAKLELEAAARQRRIAREGK